jgi:hypothetical protein
MRLSLLLLLALVTAALAAPAFAESAPLPATPAEAPVVPAAAGMMVARDPITGEIGLPSPEQARALLAGEFGAALNTGQALFEEPVAGGGWKVNVDGLLMDYAVTTLGPDGKPRLACAHDAAELARFLAAGALPAATPQPRPEEK